MTSTTILIADDHPLFRSALQQVIAQHFPTHMVLLAADVNALQQQAQQAGSIDLLLLDLHMPGATGFSALSWFSGQFRSTPVVMISANTHPDTVRRALDHGAAAFLSKSAEIESIQSCIEAVMSGQRGLHPGLQAGTTGASLQALDVAEAVSTLTAQQFRVAAMLVEGLLNKQIAYELEVKESTIKAHLTEIFRKLGVTSRTQAVLALASLGIEPPDDIAKPVE